MSALDALVRDVSLAEGGVAPRRSFTASERAGILAMRRGAVPWQFSVALLRAGLALSPQVVARTTSRTGDGQRVLRFDLRLEHEWSALDLTGLLEASLHDQPEDAPESRWRSLIGSAINGALATEPRWVELHTPLGGRRWAFDAGATRDEDPYAQQRVPSDVDEGGFSLRLAHPSEGVAAIWARWTGRQGPQGEVSRLWSEALGEAIDEDAMHEGVAALRLPAEDATELGAVGRWWPRSDGGLFLRRDGVRIADLSALVQEVGGAPLHGEVEAPRINLDVDEKGVRVDEALHELIAWMQAPTLEEVTSVVVGSAQRTPVDALRSVDEVVFAWPHRVAASQDVAGVNALTPPQLAWLRERSVASFVPASLLLGTRELRRVDLTSLEQGSIGPIRLGEVQGDEIVAFVHRHPVAKEGRVQVHGFGRVMFEALVPDLPGVTVIGMLPRGDEDIDDAQAHADTARGHAVSCADMLTQAVLAAVPDLASRFRVPWFAHRWESLSPVDLEFRYVPHGDGVRLSWRDDPLLTTTVANEADGTPRSAADALERLRDAGGVVVAEGGGRWRTLESSVPIWTPWRLTTVGGELLARLLGDVGLWRMPMVAEAQLRPERLEAQSQVCLEPARVSALRESLRSIGRSSERARCALLAHALWSRAAQKDALGLDALPLLLSFDAQAAQPQRRVSLLEVEQGAYAGVVPHGAAHRGLGREVLEATPAVAHALVELGLVPTFSLPTRPAPRRASTSLRTTRRQVWLRQRVIDPRVVGALVLADGPPGVEIWEDGLRTHTLRLPAPYRAVAGRVWTQGGHGSTEALSRSLLHAASTMADGARRALLLSVPGSARARALQGFIDTLPKRVEPSPEHSRTAAVLGSDRLAATLRFALGRAVTVEVSRVSWSLLRDDVGLERIRVGGLHPLIRGAREDGAGSSSIGAAALAVLFALHREDRISRSAFDEGAARVLAALE